MTDWPETFGEGCAALAAGRADTAVVLFRRAGATVGSAAAVACLIEAAQVALDLGRLDVADDLLQDVRRQVADYPGQPDLEAGWLLTWAALLTATREDELAEAAIRRTLTIATGRDAITEGQALWQGAHLDTLRGRYQSASTRLERAWTLFGSTHPARRALCELNLAAVAAAIGDHAAARRWAATAVESWDVLGDPGLHSQAVILQSIELAADGEHDDALTLLETTVAGLPPDSLDAAEVNLHLGAERLRTGQADAAAEALRAARLRLVDAGSAERRLAAGALLNLGHAALSSGDPALAMDRYAHAAEEFRLCGAPEWQARADVARAHVEGGPDGDPSVALVRLLPSVLYLSAKRYQFVHASRRAAWAGVFADALAEAFALAHRAGDARVIAHLVELGRNAGTYSTRTPAADVDVAAPEERAASGRTSRAGPGGALIDPDPPLPLDPPPTLVMPDGSLVLGEHFAAAAKTYEALQLSEGMVSVV